MWYLLFGTSGVMAFRQKSVIVGRMLGSVEVALSAVVVVGSSVMAGGSLVMGGSTVVRGALVVGGSVVKGGSLVAGSVVDGSTEDASVVVDSSEAVVFVLPMMLIALEVGSVELTVLMITADVKVDDSKDEVVVRGRHRLAILIAAMAGKSAMEARMVDNSEEIRSNDERGRTQRGRKEKRSGCLSSSELMSPTLPLIWRLIGASHPGPRKQSLEVLVNSLAGFFFHSQRQSNGGWLNFRNSQGLDPIDRARVQ